jgi:hypothetical protein
MKEKLELIEMYLEDIKKYENAMLELQIINSRRNEYSDMSEYAMDRNSCMVRIDRLRKIAQNSVMKLEEIKGRKQCLVS